jgi:branched-chain amino acid aminotransferase
MNRVWHVGKLVKGKIAISPFDRGLTLGDGIFETIAVKDNVALWRYEHVERMRAAASALGIPFPEDEIGSAIDAITHRAKGAHVLRLTLTRGEGARTLVGDTTKSNFLATLQPFDEALRFQPVKLAVVGTHRNTNSMSSRVTSLSYVDNILAAREANMLGAEDAVMLNTAGRVACTAIGNIFVETSDTLLTPSLSEGILPGILRLEVIKLAKLLGVKVKESKISLSQLRAADAIYTTNSLRFLRPVSRLDGKRYARGKMFTALSRGLLNAEIEQLMLE